MSLTYPEHTARPFHDPLDTARATSSADQPFVPVYARRGKARRRGGMKAWMVLVPVGLLTLGGIGAMWAMSGGDDVAAPLVEPAGTGPVLSVAPTATAGAPLTAAVAPEPAVAPPVAREVAPRRAAPAATRASASTQAPAAAAAPRVETAAPEVPAGPQPYAPAPAGPSAATLNTAPATPTAPPPVIIVEPVA